MSLAEKKLLEHFTQTKINDPDHFKHYWANPQTQVVAFSFDWEIAGQSKEEIRDTKLSQDQGSQVFFWIHPPQVIVIDEENCVDCVSATEA